jgi:GNAT superfamily N-acetyltransferase
MDTPASATQSHQSLTCLLATPSDLPSLIDLQYAACEGHLFHDAIWGADTGENRHQAMVRLRNKWQATSNYSIVKCMDTRSKTIMAWCIWEVVPPHQRRNEAIATDVMNDCTWLSEGRERELGRGYLIPAIEKRWEVMNGREYLLLTNLCTAVQWRRKGAAKALVQWGLEQAKKLGIPAYCEASEMGLYVYESLGFKKEGIIETRMDGEVIDECAVMVAGM